MNNNLMNSSEQNVQIAKSNSESTVTMQEALKGYINALEQGKQKMEKNMTKAEMVDLIYKQNSLLAQQSSQLLDMINLANNVEETTRAEELNKINLLKANNEALNRTCEEVVEIQQDQLDLYMHSIKIHVVLFVLFLLILAWLVYHYCYGSSKETVAADNSVSTKSVTSNKSTTS